jgi:hypothetical protein
MTREKDIQSRKKIIEVRVPCTNLCSTIPIAEK